jgi:hypothetical protein
VNRKVVFYNQLSGGDFTNELVMFNPLNLDNPSKNKLYSETLIPFDESQVHRTPSLVCWHHKTSIRESLPDYCLMPDENPYSVKTAYRIGEAFGDYTYPLGVLVRAFFPCDRTEKGKHNVFNMKFDPIPDIPYDWNLTFDEVVNRRAEELWSFKKPIRVWYSGGIDSTMVLVALFLNKKQEDELIVYMSRESVEENKNFYEIIKKLERDKELTIQWHDKDDPNNFFTSMENWNGSALNVTGGCAGEFYLGASNAGPFPVFFERKDKHWTELFNWDAFVECNFVYKYDHVKHNYHRKLFMEFCEQHIAKCPFEIKTSWDFIWWACFTLKWHNDSTLLSQFITHPVNYKLEHAFFNSPDFQRWSILNPELKHNGSTKTYKWPSKMYIYNFDGNEDYLNNKIKVSSLPLLWGFNKNSGIEFLEMAKKSSVIKRKLTQNKILFDDGLYYNGKDNVIPSDVDCWDLFNKDFFQDK